MTQQPTHHRTGTREAWLAARGELAKLEAEQAERNKEIVNKLHALPWVPLEKEYEFDTEDGKKTLAELLTDAHGYSHTTSCSAPSTPSAPAPAVPAWPTGSTARSSTSTTAT